MSLEIRIASLADASAACAVLRRSIVECCDADHHHDPLILDVWLGNKTVQMVECWFSSSTNFSLVALADGVLVGVAVLTRAGRLGLCYLVPEACRQGLGKAMLEGVEAQAKAWEIKVLQLYSTAGGVPFFASLGYVQAGNVRSSYGVETVFFWKQLDLDAPAIDQNRQRFCMCNPD